MQILKYQWLKEMSTLVCYAYPALIFVTFREQGQEGQSTSSYKYSSSCLSERALSARKDTRQETVNALPQWPKYWRGRSPLCLVLLNGSGVYSTSENVMGSVFAELSGLCPKLHIFTNMKQTWTLHLSSPSFYVFRHCYDPLFSKGFLLCHCKGLKQNFISEVQVSSSLSNLSVAEVVSEFMVQVLFHGSIFSLLHARTGGGSRGGRSCFQGK